MVRFIVWVCVMVLCLSLKAATAGDISASEYKNILSKIEKMRQSSDINDNKYLAEIIFKYDNRVISAAAIQALRKLADDHPTQPVITVELLIDPTNRKGFCLYVLDVFGIKKVGTIVTGIVSSGELGIGNSLVLRKADGRDIKTEAADIHFMGKNRSTKPGNNIGVLLKGISMGNVSQGDALCAQEK